ncbi:GtrA family protein [Hydrogenoanaerobacterium sp.]|uniref:GtrA family protein n=1 Tax=Hydrogenoanaerobacterium sp. TaxID=2953763 RepID=UPI00289A2808|nr:GtrA family protein [Hydrogenoanaerobacterium sp.]
MPEKFTSDDLKKFIKFGITGGINTVIDFVVYTVLITLFSVNLYAAQVVGYACGTLNSYIVNRSWTFRSKSKFFSRELIKFIVVNLITLAISLVAMYFLQQWFMGINKIVLKLPVVAVTIVVNFVLSKLWVFRG